VAIERVVDVDESRARADLDRFCFRVNVNGREPADVDDETRRAGVAAVAVATRARRERKVAFYDEVEASRDVIRNLDSRRSRPVSARRISSYRAELSSRSRGMKVGRANPVTKKKALSTPATTGSSTSPLPQPTNHPANPVTTWPTRSKTGPTPGVAV